MSEKPMQIPEHLAWAVAKLVELDAAKKTGTLSISIKPEARPAVKFEEKFREPGKFGEQEAPGGVGSIVAAERRDAERRRR